jgi:hypothetical protein
VLEAAVMKCLEKEVEDRFTTADELVEALRAEQPVELSGRVMTRAATQSGRHAAARAMTQQTRAQSDPRSEVASPPLRTRRSNRPGRVMQTLPAFAIAAAAAVIHFWPHGDTANAAPAPIHAAPVAQPATDPQPPTPPAAIAEVELSLASKPTGAELFLGIERKPLGAAPRTITLPMSSDPVPLTARFPDGREVTETIVPDAPHRELMFEQPRAESAKATKPTAAAPPVVKKTRPAAGQDRDATLDPFK